MTKPKTPQQIYEKMLSRIAEIVAEAEQEVKSISK